MRRFTPDDIATLRLMAEHGHSGLVIARQLGREPLAIRAKACALGIRLRPRKVNRNQLVRIVLDDGDWATLGTWADHFGIKRDRLARRLIEVICRDQMFYAVLDVPPPHRE